VAHILVVSTDPDKSAGIVSLLEGSGHKVTFAVDFEAAVRALTDNPPELLVSDVRLGAFNGLHLVIRCQRDHPGTATMLLDTVHDSVIRFDARRRRATYLVKPLDEPEFLAHVSRGVAAAQGPHRRWPRKQPMVGLVAEVAQRSGRLVDLSYGGFRIEVPGLERIQSRFELALPSFGVALRAKSVWTRQAPSGWFWCGAELSEPDPRSATAWRHIVDSVAGQA
jgi:DNA-binding response OmpR family regulator